MPTTCHTHLIRDYNYSKTSVEPTEIYKVNSEPPFLGTVSQDKPSFDPVTL